MPPRSRRCTRALRSDDRATVPELGRGLVTRRQLEDAGSAPGGVLERASWGVYQLAGAPVPDHRDLHGAWPQIAAPGARAQEQSPDQGVVSHRSATALYGLGYLPADQHEFTVPPGARPARTCGSTCVPCTTVNGPARTDSWRPGPSGPPLTCSAPGKTPRPWPRSRPTHRAAARRLPASSEPPWHPARRPRLPPE